MRQLQTAFWKRLKEDTTNFDFSLLNTLVIQEQPQFLIESVVVAAGQHVISFGHVNVEHLSSSPTCSVSWDGASGVNFGRLGRVALVESVRWPVTLNRRFSLHLAVGAWFEVGRSNGQVEDFNPALTIPVRSGSLAWGELPTALEKGSKAGAEYWQVKDTFTMSNLSWREKRRRPEERLRVTDPW